VDDELIPDFLVEACENLDRLERELLTAETRGTASDDGIAAMFRPLHTIKGTSAFFGFAKLQALAHASETLLAQIRDGELAFRPAIASVLLAVTDACRTILVAIAATSGEGDDSHDQLLTRLDELTHGNESDPAGDGVKFVKLSDTPDGPDTSVRVDLALLGKLLDLTGELVLARNQLAQLAARSSDAGFTGAAHRLDRITSELQDSVMRTRMQPIGNVWAKLPRVVRDLAAELGKQVRVELVGKDIGVDRSILEAIKDPLTHLIRNAVDHGIETPECRAELGKPDEGTLRLRASHEGGHVMLEIRDDGGGIDVERVRAKAIETGVLSSDRALRMPEAELLQLIFAPGFSTADKVTSISGRGVGMDVVRANIEAIGGVVDVHSIAGAGTTFRIKIPLTLAVVPALIVSAGGERYAIPQVAVAELVRLDRRALSTIDGVPIYRLRGRLLPLVDLGHMLDGGAPLASESRTIVVARCGATPFGIAVAAVHDTAEIVVKPLGKPLAGIHVYAGATILGDGSVALILDVRGIAERAGISTAGEPVTPAVRDRAPTQALLVAHAGGRRLALPLAEVARLEDLAASAVEYSHGREVVQYRAQLLPLVRLTDRRCERLRIIVHAGSGRELGLVVDDIIDVVEEPIEHDGGAAVVAGRVTDLLDVATLAAGAWS
jgi:two-component system, chemotaxis family, sensor kinase CheA